MNLLNRFRLRLPHFMIRPAPVLTPATGTDYIRAITHPDDLRALTHPDRVGANLRAWSEHDDLTASTHPDDLVLTLVAATEAEQTLVVPASVCV
jgi:hypothetical protein